MSTAHHLTVVRCTYKIENFIEFEDRLDRSLQRDLIKIDHVRMRFVVEPPTAETLALEIGELDYMYMTGKGMWLSLSAYTP